MCIATLKKRKRKFTDSRKEEVTWAGINSRIKEKKHCAGGWLTRERHVPPSLTTWIRSPGPHLHVVLCPPQVCQHRSLYTHIQVFKLSKTNKDGGWVDSSALRQLAVLEESSSVPTPMLGSSQLPVPWVTADPTPLSGLRKNLNIQHGTHSQTHPYIANTPRLMISYLHFSI